MLRSLKKILVLLEKKAIQFCYTDCLSLDSLVGRWSVAIKEKASVFPTLSSSCSSSRLSQYFLKKEKTVAV